MKRYKYCISAILLSLSLLTFGDKVIADRETPAPGNDGGGGNGINGLPLESYIVNVRDLPEYQQQVQPVMDRLKSILPSLETKLQTVLDEKSFYFVPVELARIPSKVIGVSFRTDQMALQTEYAVWIDSNLYNSSRKLRPKATLLIHELVMALRLEEVSTSTECNIWYYNRCRSELDNDDYESVREMTSVLINKLHKMTPESLQAKLVELGLGRFEIYLRPDRPYMDAPAALDFYNMIVSENLRRALPYSSTDGTGCAFVARYDDSKQEMSLEIYRGSNGYPRRDTQPYYFVVKSAPVVTTNNLSAIYTYIDEKSETLRKVLTVKMNDDAIFSIDAYWERKGYNYRTRTPDWERFSGPKGTLAPGHKTCLNYGSNF